MHLRPRFPRPTLSQPPPPLQQRRYHTPPQQQQWYSASQSAYPLRRARVCPYRHLRNNRPLSSPLLSSQNFSTTQPRSAEPTNHYEVLGVEPTVTQPELKKRFYVLSKEHHPDLHPGQNKSTHIQKFQQISESYSVLGDPEKRRRYDRDVLPRFHYQQSHESGNGGGTARGRTYAGSRAPTGLSKRASAFRGPPPSYFRHGAGGNYDPNVNPEAGKYQSSSAGGDGQAYSEEYPGAYAPQGTAADFDARGVFRTQTHEDARRNARRQAAMAAAQAAAEEDGDFWGRFVIISCVLLTGLSLGSLLVGRMDGSGAGRGGMVRGDGSRRGERAKEEKR